MKKHFLLIAMAAITGFGLQAQNLTVHTVTEPPQTAEDQLSSGLTQSGKATSLKASGIAFWEEQFDWGDPESPIGWYLPEDWTLEDNGDTGYNWHWANDTLRGTYTNEAPFMSTSTENGFLALNVDGYNADILNYADYLAVNNSIISPVIDCSQHSSVLVKVEQRFRYWSSSVQLFEVTNDDGVHWAAFDMRMGTLINETVAGLGPREKVDLYINISDVAAGMPEVQFRITWRDARLYYWMIDDIVFMEGWDNDLQMLYVEADYDNGLPEDPEGFFYQIPKTQLSSYHFHSIVRNFGNLEQWGTHMNVKVMKNNAYIWDQNSDPYVSYPMETDTLVLEQAYMPEEFGHYKIDVAIQSENEDEIPQDNSASMLFHVTDSVFSRADDTRETSFTTWAWYTVDHEGDYMGSWYTMKQDEEVNSISVYINGADINYSIAVSLFTDDPETGEVFELLTSELIPIDSTILKNHWVTIPLDKDGEGEFLEAGKSYMAAVYFTSPMPYEEAYDSRRYSIGSDRSYFYPSGKCWYYFAVDDAWYGSGTDNFMIKMNLNRNDNIIDGIPLIESKGSLSQNYPNPFNHSTRIAFQTAQDDELFLIVRDLTGRVVYSENLGRMTAGSHEVALEASNLESGTYLYSLSGQHFNETKRLTVTK